MPLLRTLSLFLLFAFSTTLWAGDAREFHLKDGSTLTGELVEVTGGRFVVQTQSLGRVELDADQVVSMNTPGAVQDTPKALAGAGGGDLETLMAQVQGRIYSDPALLEQIQGLSKDPQLNSLISDPAFVELLMSGDLEAIQQDPRTRQLMQNSRLQGLVQQLSGGL